MTPQTMFTTQPTAEEIYNENNQPQQVQQSGPTLSINEKAMLVNLNLSFWRATKKDKAVTRETNARYNASEDAGNYTAHLIAKDVLKEGQKLKNKVYTFHLENTLPWMDTGQRILTAANFIPYSTKINELIDNYLRWVTDQFIPEYNKHVKEAETRRGAMFNPYDYPSAQELRRKFGADISFFPIPSADDFRVDLQSAEVQRIQRNIEERLKATFEAANRDLWQRLYDNVKHMADKLNERHAKDPEAWAVFRDSLVNNLCDLCELLPRLNVTDDNKLEDLRRKVEGQLCKYEPQTLREDEPARQETAEAAADILKELDGYMF